MSKTIVKPKHYTHEVTYYIDKAGEVRWTAAHKNSNKVGDSSEGYKKKLACKKALDNFVKAYSEGKVVFTDLTKPSKQ